MDILIKTLEITPASDQVERAVSVRVFGVDDQLTGWSFLFPIPFRTLAIRKPEEMVEEGESDCLWSLLGPKSEKERRQADKCISPTFDTRAHALGGEICHTASLVRQSTD